MNSWLLTKVKLGVGIFVAAYGNAVVEEVPPLVVCTRFLTLNWPVWGSGEGLGVGVGVGVAVGVGVGVGAGPPPSHEYRSLFGEPTPVFVRMPVVAASRIA